MLAGWTHGAASVIPARLTMIYELNDAKKGVLVIRSTLFSYVRQHTEVDLQSHKKDVQSPDASAREEHKE